MPCGRLWCLHLGKAFKRVLFTLEILVDLLPPHNIVIGMSVVRLTPLYYTLNYKTLGRRRARHASRDAHHCAIGGGVYRADPFAGRAGDWSEWG